MEGELVGGEEDPLLAQVVTGGEATPPTAEDKRRWGVVQNRVETAMADTTATVSGFLIAACFIVYTGAPSLGFIEQFDENTFRIGLLFVVLAFCLFMLALGLSITVRINIALRTAARLPASKQSMDDLGYIMLAALLGGLACVAVVMVLIAKLALERAWFIANASLISVTMALVLVVALYGVSSLFAYDHTARTA